MGELFWAHGHIAWSLFAAVTFSLVLLLGFDALWRFVRLPVKKLAAIAIFAWLAGLVAIYAV